MIIDGFEFDDDLLKVVCDEFNIDISKIVVDGEIIKKLEQISFNDAIKNRKLCYNIICENKLYSFIQVKARTDEGFYINRRIYYLISEIKNG